MRIRSLLKTVAKRVADLRPHPLQAQVYQDLGDAELQALAEDIRVNGLRQPIEITPDGVVICGHQRLRAVKLLGLKKINCIVRDDLAAEGDAAVERRLVEDNLNRRNLGRLGVVRACAALMKITNKEDVQGTTLRDFIAVRFNLSGRTIDRHLKFLEAPAVVQEAWDRRQLTDGDMRQVLQASSRRQKQIAEQIRAGKPPKKAVRETAGKPERPAPTVETSVSQVIRALTQLRAVLPRDEEAWSVAAWSTMRPQLQSGRRLLRRLCEQADSQLAAEASP